MPGHRPNKGPRAQIGPIKKTVEIPGPGGPISDHFGQSPKNPARPPRVLPYFDTSGPSYGPATPTTSFASQFPAGGCPQTPIWSREGPNQTQNHVFGRSRLPAASPKPSQAKPSQSGFIAGQEPPSAALAAEKTSVVSAAKTSVVSAAKKAATAATSAATSDISMESTTTSRVWWMGLRCQMLQLSWLPML